MRQLACPLDSTRQGSISPPVEMRGFSQSKQGVVRCGEHFSWQSGYYDYRLYNILDQPGYYMSRIIEFARLTNITNAIAYTTEYLNSTMDVYVSSNTSGAFDNWTNVTYYNETNIRYLRYLIYLNTSYAHLASIFHGILFNYSTYWNVFPNLNDRNLIIYPQVNTTQTYYSFNISAEPQFQAGEIEFIFIHCLLPSQDIQNNQYNMFTVLFDNETQFKYTLSDWLPGNGTVFGNWSVWAGGTTYQVIHSQPYYNLTETGMCYMIYDVVIDYIYNSKSTITVNQMTSRYTSELLFENDSAVVQTSAPSEVTYAEFFFGSNQSHFEPMFFMGVDSSRISLDYERNEMLTYVTKYFETYNVEDIFTLYIPDITSDMTGAYVSNIQIQSELPYETFTSFFCDVQGSEGEQTFTIIDTLTNVSSTVYDGNEVYGLTFNTRYRCKNLNYFQNTITMEVTYIYTPAVIGVMDLFILALPTTVLLIVPSSAAYIKFKRNGFLMIFFAMTIILTAVGMIPAVIGILMILVQVIIFYKLIQSDRKEGE